MDLIRSKILWTAVASRLLILGLSVISNLFIPDHNPDVFRWILSPSYNTSGVTDFGVALLTDGLTGWDGQYFLHIANNGYTYENTLAFFPMYPMLTKVAGDAIYWLQVEYGFLHFSSALKIGGILVNFVAFLMSSLIFFDLSQKVLRDDVLAYRASLFFCLNPASIFFSATYSETLNCLFTLYALNRLEKGFSIKTALFFAATTACRSNSILNAGFIIYKGLKIFTRELSIHARLKQLERSDLSETTANLIGDSVFPTLLTLVTCVIPFGLFQWYGFTQFCSLTKPKEDYGDAIINNAETRGLKLPSAEPSEWCYDALPMPYSYIQSHYWNVGFLKYFEFKQIPNFLLALPLVYIILKHSWRYFTYHKFYSLRLGCTYFCLDPAQKVPHFDMYQTRILPRECFVYVVHAAALTIFCFFFIHVQVTTRLICSASPVLYWIVALVTCPEHMSKNRPICGDLNNPNFVYKLEKKENLDDMFKSIVIEEKTETKEAFWIKMYFVSYALVGTILFSNFLPWT